MPPPSRPDASDLVVRGISALEQNTARLELFETRVGARLDAIEAELREARAAYQARTPLLDRASAALALGAENERRRLDDLAAGRATRSRAIERIWNTQGVPPVFIAGMMLGVYALARWLGLLNLILPTLPGAHP